MLSQACTAAGVTVLGDGRGCRSRVWSWSWLWPAFVLMRTNAEALNYIELFLGAVDVPSGPVSTPTGTTAATARPSLTTTAGVPAIA